MSKKLRDYCRWNWPDRVKAFLDENPGTIDITSEDGAYIRLAISHNSPQMLEALLAYFVASLPADRRSQGHATAIHKMIEIFDDYIDFEDLSPTIRSVIHKYLPSLEEKALIEAAANGNTTIINELYPYFPDSTKDILNAAIAHEQYGIIEVLTDMAVTQNDAAMILCKAADISSNYANTEKTISLYERSIEVSPKYFIAPLHYANYLQKHYCNDIIFDPAVAVVAKSHYEAVIKASPKYACAYKKLGMLYQTWGNYDSTNANELAKKAFDAYVQAIECKTEILKYESIYLAVEHLIEKFGCFVPEVLIQDPKLNEIISSASSIFTQSRKISISSADTLPMTDEDIEYEEYYMDDDLHIKLCDLELSGAAVAINDEAP